MTSQKLAAQSRLGEWLVDLGFPPAVENHRFSDERKFEMDWAWPALKIGIEVEGGIWSGGAHGRGVGIERDMEKQNLATLDGWRVFRVTTKQATNGNCLILIGRMFGLEITQLDLERFDKPGRRERRLKKEVAAARAPTKVRKIAESGKAESPLGLDLKGKPLFRKRRY